MMKITKETNEKIEDVVNKIGKELSRNEEECEKAIAQLHSEWIFDLKTLQTALPLGLIPNVPLALQVHLKHYLQHVLDEAPRVFLPEDSSTEDLSISALSPSAPSPVLDQEEIDQNYIIDRLVTYKLAENSAPV